MELDVEHYLNCIKKKIKPTDYNLTDFQFSSFELINLFLIDKAINKEINLFIKANDRENEETIYLPMVLSVAIALFWKNYCDDKTCYNIDDVVQKDGKRFIVTRLDGKNIELRCDDKYNTKIITSNPREYIVTTANLSQNKVKTKFDNYKRLFNLLFNVDYCPSKFSYKSIIIIEKKGFIDSLKQAKFNSILIHKALPIKWVTKNGIEKNESEYIPIEPMIYLVPDYETFEEHVAEEIENLDSVIFMGKNKYMPNLTQIRRHVRTRKIPFAIFIGKETPKDVKALRLWNWTHPELCYFNDISQGSFSIVEVYSEFLNLLAEFEAYIKKLDKDFSFYIYKLFHLKKFLYSLVMPDEKSRLSSQFEYVKHLMKHKFSEKIKENFYLIDENPQKFITNSDEFINLIFSKIGNEKFYTLLAQSQIDILLVPDRFESVWKEEIQKNRILSKIKIFKIYDFLARKYNTQKNVYLLTIFGYSLHPLELLKELTNSIHHITLILYPEEKLLVEKLQAKYHNELLAEYNSQDRFELTGVKFPYQKNNEEEISDILNRFYLAENENESRQYDYELSESVRYLLKYDSFDDDELEGSKTVLLENDRNSHKERVMNLLVGDKIRVYENSSREKLWEIANNEDEAGKFNEVIAHSKLWKIALSAYYTKHLLTEESLLHKLQNSGGTISSLITIKKWLDFNDTNLFPAKNSDLTAIRKMLNADFLNDNFELIKKSRTFYRSTMIALGRDLSDEIIDYILSGKKQKGKILSRFSENQIASFINESAPLKTIGSIRIMENNDDE